MLQTGEELDSIGRLDLRYPDCQMAFLNQKVVTAMRVGLDTLATHLAGQSAQGTNWALKSLQGVAKEILSSGREPTPIQKRVVFDRLYEVATYAFRNGQRGHSLTAYEVWSRAGLNRPSYPSTNLLNERTQIHSDIMEGAAPSVSLQASARGPWIATRLPHCRRSKIRDNHTLRTAHPVA